MIWKAEVEGEFYSSEDFEWDPEWDLVSRFQLFEKREFDFKLPVSEYQIFKANSASASHKQVLFYKIKYLITEELAELLIIEQPTKTYVVSSSASMLAKASRRSYRIPGNKTYVVFRISGDQISVGFE